MTVILGRVWKFGDNISADNGIINYSQVPDLGTFDIEALRAMCFVAFDPEFPDKARIGDIIVAGCNFGHHSHPHACVAMKACGIAAVLVDSTDSAFIRKALNIGLPIVPCRGITGIVETGGELEIDMTDGIARNTKTGETREFRPFAKEMIEVWQAGGLAAALRQRIAAEQTSKPASTAGAS